MSFDCLQTNPLAPCGNDPVSYVIERVFPLVIYRCLFLLALARVVRVSVCLQLAYVAMYECAPQSWQNGRSRRKLQRKRNPEPTHSSQSGRTKLSTLQLLLSLGEVSTKPTPNSTWSASFGVSATQGRPPLRGMLRESRSVDAIGVAGPLPEDQRGHEVGVHVGRRPPVLEVA
jgi:hypothetical protein